MTLNSEEILHFWDGEAERFTFPMLDNGYYYLAATRLSLFRSSVDWGMVIEVFSHNPRGFGPEIHLYVFASRLHNRDAYRVYPSDSDHQNYLRDNPHTEFGTAYPVEEGPWKDSEDSDLLAVSGWVRLRDEVIALPDRGEYGRYGVELEEERPSVFEFCRYLAAIRRDKVLATPEERRAVIPLEMKQILQLEEWHHPNLLKEKPSETETFRLLAKVLETGDASIYTPSEPSNTHWSNWPDGGTL